MNFLETALIPENLVYVAGALYVGGLAITNQIILRLMLLTGTAVYTLYYSIVGDNPLWPAIYVSILIGLANIGGLTSLIARRSRLAIPRAHADIYDDFPDLPPGDFRALMALSRRYRVTTDQQITVQGEPGSKLYYILKGNTLVRKDDQAFVLPPGLFLGEIAFLTGMSCSASAWIEEGSEVLEWRFDTLQRKCDKSPRFKLALEAAISLDLADKVARSMGPDSVHINTIPAPMVEALAAVRRA